ncbi:organelle RRM domain-containing protein 6, chloroplastic-like isoform X1 [Malania oleifera]|uniref:organelle RRM domain-containing protein 6, chloroplastic-like isoform X1 n=1 Tax=Malania oleifera TaxID=397392 RepID=UPI0025ADCAAD|nr:organelle RRM domain-containing protein 6, chloroplastic-like isoform X1 [Malania oleifera]
MTAQKLASESRGDSPQMAAATALTVASTSSLFRDTGRAATPVVLRRCSSSASSPSSPSSGNYYCSSRRFLSLSLCENGCRRRRGCFFLACLPSSPKRTSGASKKLYVSGLSFRTTEESLRNAFQNFGQLQEVNLVMDKIANRPRGFAFLRYETEEESKKAIEGMHGKFLDGRVIFVEVAKPRSELRQGRVQSPIQQ